MTMVPDNPGLLDIVEARMLHFGGEARAKGGNTSTAPVTHRFTPGLYIREIFMPAGSVITSSIHNTEHPYVVSQGRCLVYREDQDRWDTILAPYTGITVPGTRRFLIILEDTIWTTFHVTSKTDVAEIEDEIMVPYENPLLDYSDDVPKLKEGAERLLT